MNRPPHDKMLTMLKERWRGISRLFYKIWLFISRCTYPFSLDISDFVWVSSVTDKTCSSQINPIGVQNRPEKLHSVLRQTLRCPSYNRSSTPHRRRNWSPLLMSIRSRMSKIWGWLTMSYLYTEDFERTPSWVLTLCGEQISSLIDSPLSVITEKWIHVSPSPKISNTSLGERVAQPKKDDNRAC